MWTKVMFENSYKNPVVILGALSGEGSNSITL